MQIFLCVPRCYRQHEKRVRLHAQKYHRVNRLTAMVPYMEKHRTPSEKEKKGTPKVFQHVRFSPTRSKKSQPNKN